MTSSSEADRLRAVHKYHPTLSQKTLPPEDRAILPEFSGLNVGQAVPDTSLTAFLQLVTWRLSVQRAVISLVDKDDQYFIAESTKTGNLIDPSIYEKDGDQMWMGCNGYTTRSEALCSNTIKAEAEPGIYPCFIVTDLQKDPRFCNISFVAGPPFFRFYAGTPLVTKYGYRIGALFAIDDRVRAPLTDAEVEFLGVIAKNAMDHLEMKQEYQQQQRHMTMSRGLAAFVEGKSRIPSDWKRGPGVPTGTTAAHAEAIDSVEASEPDERGSIDPKIDANIPAKDQESAMTKALFSRAANILRESLDVDFAVFLDTGEEKSLAIESRKANVVGFSSNEESTISNQDLKFNCTIHRDFLKSLRLQYPLGKIWSYHEDGKLDYDEEDPMALTQDNDGAVSQQTSECESGSKRSTESESKVLRRCFPNARQILYAPLWDSGNPDYLAACFAVSNHEVPVFTTEIESTYVRAFVNSISVVSGHITAVLSDKQKAEFISNFSHELRTPLHGIIASMDLLSGSSLNNVQRDLCDTVEVCGQTLLDTISQILDFTKVNNFLRNSQTPSAPKPHGERNRASSLSDRMSSIHAGSSLNVYSECDVASLCEDAVEVVTLGFKKMAENSFLGSKMLSRRQMGDSESKTLTHLIQNTAVTMEVYIENANWLFTCAPGAIRRIVMNIVGNSLKYTQSGYIRVDLKLDESMVSSAALGSTKLPKSNIKLSISDTGKGISAEFLKTKLFVPFSQESTFSTGSGLGLSLVRSILNSLDGTIDISSTVGEGTTVQIGIPLTRASSRSSETLDADGPNQPHAAIASWCEHKTYSVFGNKITHETRVKHSIDLYMRKWFGAREVSKETFADIVFLAETDLDLLLTGDRGAETGRHAIVLFDAPPTKDIRSMSKPGLPSLEPMVIPFGPKRLSRVLHACLDKPSDIVIQVNGSQILNTVSCDRDSGGEQQRPGLPGDIDTSQPRQFSDDNIQVPTFQSMPPLLRRAPASVHSSFSTLKRPRVLCVDDNLINLKLLSSYTKKLAFENVETAVDGLQAFEAVQKCVEGFDLIFMDLSMPVCDGFESTRRIRELEKGRMDDPRMNEIPNSSVIIALTGLASEMDQKKAFAAGVNHFVTKPLRFEDLKKLLVQWNILETADAAKKDANS